MIGKQLSGMRVDIFYDYRNVKPEDMRRWHRDQKETEVMRRWHRDQKETEVTRRWHRD